MIVPFYHNLSLLCRYYLGGILAVCNFLFLRADKRLYHFENQGLLSYSNLRRGGEIAQGKAKDAGGLTPAKDDSAPLRDCYPRTFARNSDDCYNINKRSQPYPCANYKTTNGPATPYGNSLFFVVRLLK